MRKQQKEQTKKRKRLHEKRLYASIIDLAGLEDNALYVVCVCTYVM